MRKLKDGTEYITARIDPELKSLLVAEARAQERPVSQVILFFIRQGLGIAKTPKPRITNNSDPSSQAA